MPAPCTEHRVSPLPLLYTVVSCLMLHCEGLSSWGIRSRPPMHASHLANVWPPWMHPGMTCQPHLCPALAPLCRCWGLVVTAADYGPIGQLVKEPDLPPATLRAGRRRRWVCGAHATVLTSWAILWVSFACRRAVHGPVHLDGDQRAHLPVGIQTWEETLGACLITQLGHSLADASGATVRASFVV